MQNNEKRSVSKPSAGEIYDRNKRPPMREPFPAPEGAKCKECGKPASINVHIPWIFVGNICDGCRFKILPEPYDGTIKE